MPAPGVKRTDRFVPHAYHTDYFFVSHADINELRIFVLSFGNCCIVFT